MSDGGGDRTSSANGLTALIAIGTFAILIALSAYKQQHHNERQEAASANAKAAVNSCSFGGATVPDLTCLSQQMDAVADHSYAAYDLRAQQEMAEWALLMLIVTALGVIYVAMTLGATQAAVDAATKSNEIMAKSSELEWRPYIIMDGLELTTPGDGQHEVIITPFIKNIGKVAACITKFGVEKYVFPAGDPCPWLSNPTLQFRSTVCPPGRSKMDVVQIDRGSCNQVLEKRMRIVFRFGIEYTHFGATGPMDAVFTSFMAYEIKPALRPDGRDPSMTFFEVMYMRDGAQVT